jgi:NAD(P)-dependent dehydrogenase (short-subunit alcohol dehydrogenase family)
MKIDLTGKTAIVTGSTGGIGFAIAKGLAEAGATVIVNGRSQAAVDNALAELAGDYFLKGWARAVNRLKFQTDTLPSRY